MFGVPVNGNFSSASAPGTVEKGSDSLPGWEVIKGSVELTDTWAPQGDRFAIHLVGSSAGGIQQASRASSLGLGMFVPQKLVHLWMDKMEANLLAGLLPCAGRVQRALTRRWCVPLEGLTSRILCISKKKLIKSACTGRTVFLLFQLSNTLHVPQLAHSEMFVIMSAFLTVAFLCTPAEVPDDQGLHVHRPIWTRRAPWVRRLRPGPRDRGRLPGAALLRALQGPRTSELGRHCVRFHSDWLHLHHPL
jgi:hypothetical protein